MLSLSQGFPNNSDTDVGSVVRKVNTAIHRIVIFQLPQKDIKSNDTRDNELTKDESDFNSKMLNFNMPGFYQFSYNLY